MRGDRRTVLLVVLGWGVLSVAGGIFWSMNRETTAELVLIVERREGTTDQEFADFSNAQRKIVISDFVLRKAMGDPLIGRTRFVKRERDPVAAMSKRLAAASSDDLSRITVTFRCRDAEEAVTILNEIVDEYFTEVVVAARVQRDRHYASVERSIRSVTANIEMMKTLKAEAESGGDLASVKLSEWRITLAQIRNDATDRKRTLDRALQYIDEKIAEDSSDAMTVGDLMKVFDRRLPYVESRYQELTSSLSEWKAHQGPRIRVLEHASIVAR